MKADKLAELQKRITFLERELAKERGDRIHAEDERDSVADTMLRFSAKIRKLEKEIKDYKSQIILQKIELSKSDWKFYKNRSKEGLLKDIRVLINQIAKMQKKR